MSGAPVIAAAHDTTHDATPSLASPPGRWFAAGAIAMALLSLPTQLVFEHALGVAGFAQWLLANSLVSFFVPLAALGSSNLVLSDYYGGHLAGPDGPRHLARFYLATTAVAAIVFLLIYGWGPWDDGHSRMDAVLATLVLVFRAPVVLVYPLMQIHRDARLVAVWPAIENLGRLVLAAAALTLSLRFTAVLGAWVLLMALLAVTSFGYIWRRRPLPAPPVRITESHLRSLIARGLRFGIAEYLDSLDLKLAVPLAALVLSPRQIAAAGIGLLFLNAVHFLPFLIVSRFLLPAVHTRSLALRAAMRDKIARWLRYAAVTMTAGAMLFAWIGDDIVVLVTEAGYRDEMWFVPFAAAAMIPLSLSTIATAPFQRIEWAHHLTAWRVQSLAVFAIVTMVAASPFGAGAPMAGIAVARSYLLLRLITALPRTAAAEQRSAP